MARLTFSRAPSRAPSRALSAHQQHLSLSCSFMLFHALSCRAHARWQHITPRSTRLRQPQFGSQFHQYAPNLVRCLLVYRGLMLLQQVVAKKQQHRQFRLWLAFNTMLHPSASPVGFTRRLHLLASRRRRHTVSFTTRQFGCAVLARVTRRTASSNVLISNGFGKRQTRVGEPGGNTVAGSPDTNTHPIARPSTSSARA